MVSFDDDGRDGGDDVPLFYYHSFHYLCFSFRSCQVHYSSLDSHDECDDDDEGVDDDGVDREWNDGDDGVVLFRLSYYVLYYHHFGLEHCRYDGGDDDIH